MTGDPDSRPDAEGLELWARVITQLPGMVFDHMRSHTIAANAPSWSDRREAKKASKGEYSLMLDTIKSLGVSETEARTVALTAYREASASNPPISDLDSLNVVADDASARILGDLSASGYFDLDQAVAFVKNGGGPEEQNHG